ncbi:MULTISPECIES: hypothetical protein [unclassified Sphingomonas]|jgi:hypothetical protein|uniref:hypothetical protein n=1 Tax=unclassified Sphingomonas TaxID=196159 RepID=UPI0018E53CEC|nr:MULTISPECIES: hypothetical protein [unclassified Sphingomonas]
MTKTATNTARHLMKSDFFWRFVGGFAIGAVGVVALQPASAEHHDAAVLSAPAPAQTAR